MRPFSRRYTTAKEGIPANDRSRSFRTDRVADRSGKRTRSEWKPAPRAERRVGPIVINERTGRPYTPEQCRYNFRLIARKAGIPDTLWNMDARAGAVTEAYEAGATTEGGGEVGALLLSKRELDVVRLLGRGHSNRRLAGELAMAPDTVKWHLKNIFGKLGVASRSQAILEAQRRGLLV